MSQVLGVFFSLLISAPAMAADEAEVPVEALANRTELSGALSQSVLELSIVRRGVGGRMMRHVSPVFAFGVEGAYYPDLGTAQWTPLVRELAVRNVPADFEYVVGHAAGRVEFTPVSGAFTAMGKSGSIGFYGVFGFGIAYTRSDGRQPGCLGVFGPCDPLSTANQVHPSTTLGVGLRLHHKRLISRLELRDVGYIETYDGISLGIEHLLLTDLSVGVLLGRR